MERTTTGRRRAVPKRGASRGAVPTPNPDRPPPEPPRPAPTRRSPDYPPARGTAGSIDPAESLARQIEAAAESGGLEIVTLDGESSDSVEMKLEKTPPKPAERPPPAVEEPAPPPPTASAPREDPLALDLGSGPGPAPLAGAAPPDPRLGPAPAMPPQSSYPAPSAPSASGAYAHAPSASGSFAQGGREPAPPEPAPGRGLFSRDSVANYMFGVAAGLVIGLVAAFQASRALDREDIMALEDKLAESYVKPIEVENGELQRPDAIEKDLEAMYGDTRTFFLLTMILSGIPVGLGLGRIQAGLGSGSGAGAGSAFALGFAAGLGAGPKRRLAMISIIVCRTTIAPVRASSCSSRRSAVTSSSMGRPATRSARDQAAYSAGSSRKRCTADAPTRRSPIVVGQRAPNHRPAMAASTRCAARITSARRAWIGPANVLARFASTRGVSVPISGRTTSRPTTRAPRAVAHASNPSRAAGRIPSTDGTSAAEAPRNRLGSRG